MHMSIGTRGGVNNMQIISSQDFEYEFVNDEGKTVFLTSEGIESCLLVREVLKSVTVDKVNVFFASGLLDNLTELMEIIGCDKCTLKQNDAKKSIQKRLPEFFAIIGQDADILDSILQEWVSTIYERRVLINVDKSKLEEVEKIIFSDGLDINNFANVWALSDIIVENAPEAPSHNSFIISYKNHIESKLPKELLG